MEDIILRATIEVTQILAISKVFELLRKGYTIEETEKETKKYVDEIIKNLRGENSNAKK